MKKKDVFLEKFRINSGVLRVARGGSGAKVPPLAARPLFLRSYQRYTITQNHFTCQLTWTLYKLMGWFASLDSCFVCVFVCLFVGIKPEKLYTLLPLLQKHALPSCFPYMYVYLCACARMYVRVYLWIPCILFVFVPYVYSFFPTELCTCAWSKAYCVFYSIFITTCVFQNKIK